VWFLSIYDSFRTQERTRRSHRAETHPQTRSCGRFASTYDINGPRGRFVSPAKAARPPKPAYGLPGMNSLGLRTPPLTRTSKCTCGPVE
jgi:hypothetical protein